MITIAFILFFIIAGAALCYTAYKKHGSPGPHLLPGIAIAVVGVFASFFQPFALERVDAGHVGIKVNLTGDARGVSGYEYKTGWVIFNTWFSDLLEFPTFQKNVKYEKQTVITRGGFNAEIAPTFTYATVPGNVGDMFKNLRVDMDQIESGWLHTVVVGSINDVTNRWTVDDIFNKREQFEGDITMEVNKRVKKWFVLTQLRTNIVPPAALQKSIEEKTQALQEVQVAENRKLVAIAEGQTKIAGARADSAALVIQAAGEAEAIKRKQLTLSGTYIDYIKAQKWDGKLPHVQAGNSGMLLNVGEK